MPEICQRRFIGCWQYQLLANSSDAVLHACIKPTILSEQAQQPPHENLVQMCVAVRLCHSARLGQDQACCVTEHTKLWQKLCLQRTPRNKAGSLCIYSAHTSVPHLPCRQASDLFEHWVGRSSLSLRSRTRAHQPDSPWQVSRDYTGTRSLLGQSASPSRENPLGVPAARGASLPREFCARFAPSVLPV